MWLTKKITISSGVWFCGFIFICSFLVLFTDAVSRGVQQGLMLCGQVIIPALFVFLCLCEWICISGRMQRCLICLSPFFRILFGRYFEAGTALFLCLIGGYPMGAATLTRLGENKTLSPNQIKRLSLWVFCPSPAFVINGVGIGMLGSAKAGVVLWSCCVISCLLTGVLFCRFPETKNENYNTTRTMQVTKTAGSFVEAVASATQKMLLLCGTVVLSSGVVNVVNVLPLPVPVKTIFCSFLEVTNGCVYLSENGGSLASLGGVLMFGGLCTHLQCLLLLKNKCASYKSYFAVRILQAALCYGLLTLVSFCFPNTFQTLSFGNSPTVGDFSILHSVALLGTCLVFLCSIYQKPFLRRNSSEKSRIRT